MTIASSTSTHFVVTQKPGRHLAFPDACRLADGALLVVYREGAGHFDFGGRIMITRCSTPAATLEFEPSQVVCDTDLDDRDPSITQLSDGSLLINFVRYIEGGRGKSDVVMSVDSEGNKTPVPNGFIQESRLAIVRSYNGGRHWEAPEEILIPNPPENQRNKLATTDAVLELPSGELLMPIHGVQGSYILRSTDGGQSWPEFTPMAVAPAPIFEEPTLAQLNDGRLLAFLRTDNQGKGYLYQTMSHDEGRTWSPPHKLSLWGYPAHLLPLRNGRLLATYGYRKNPFGIRYCVARRGPTWSLADEYGLRTDGYGDLGYPSSIELEDGAVFTVYYFNGRVNEPRNISPYIVGTRYTPK